MDFLIQKGNDGKTVLSFLKSKLKISSTMLTALKRDDKGILVNGSHVTVRYVLKENDILSINEKDSTERINESIIPVDIPLNILYENGDIIIVDKPSDMPTHPSHGHIDDTLANAIAFIFNNKKEPFIFRPIGRLDRNTSGISLIAKHGISASYLFYARQKKMIQKKYIAILNGSINGGGNFSTIETYMKRQEDSVIVRCIGNDGEPGAYKAITHWRLLYSGNDISIVEAIPETGRTHQLRVHFSYIGHPILGDDIYGSASEYIPRHALHAAYLSLPIPYTENIRIFTAMIPDDMINAISEICQEDTPYILSIIKQALLSENN